MHAVDRQTQGGLHAFQIELAPRLAYVGVDPGIRRAVIIPTIVLLIGVTAALVHATGGVDGPYTYVMLLPVLLGAAVYGIAGGLGTALLGALSIGPVMPADVASGLEQSAEAWLVRLAAFAVVGLVAGASHERLRRWARQQQKALRCDPATGLANQAAFMEDLTTHLGARHGTEVDVTVVLVRATDFADIVEVVGIEDGDQVIREVGQHLSRVCPDVSESYRFSTSELAFIAEPQDREALKRVARTLHGAAAVPFEVDGVPVRIEPVLGIGHRHTDAAVDAWELVRRARAALRRALSLDRNWVSYEPVLDHDPGATIELIGRAEQALEAGEFELHYQPKVRLSDGRPIGVEALARWRRPNEGLVAPGSFMPKLEQTSLIDPFSRFVIRVATDYARSGPLVPVSINLAPRNLADETLADALIEGLQQTGTAPEDFEVEVTESGMMREPRAAIAFLNRLREYGIGISIDDFGTGYASFAYLRQLPATNLKIDRAFVRPLEGDAKTRRLVLAMIDAGHALDLTITAEGVETPEQARILTELDCDFGQGFLWSRPLEETALREWLEASSQTVPA